MADHLVRAVLSDGSARILAAVTTDLSRELASRHRLEGGAQVALSRGATAALLLATLTKDQERVTLQVAGDGALGGVTADAWADGRVRAYLPRKEVPEVPASSSERLLLGPWLGRHGVVNVVRDLGRHDIGLHDKYTGQAAMVTGEIDEDVENYLRTSEQIPSALGCETVMGPDGTVAAAAGILVQSLPQADSMIPPVVRAVQHRLRTKLLYDALVARAHEAEGAPGLMRVLLEEAAAGLELLETTELRFSCGCTSERVDDMLRMLGSRELETLIVEDGRAEVFCDFCNERYEYSDADLERLRRETTETPSS